MTETRRAVLVVHPSPDLYGSDRVVLETVDAFVLGDWRVVVSVPAEGPLTAELRSRGVEVEVCPTVVLRKAFLRPAGVLRLAGTAFAAARPSWLVLESSCAELVWVNTITLPLWALLARLRGRSVVVHAHEAEDGVSPLLRGLLAMPLLLANTVVVNSTATGRSLAGALGSLRSRIRRVYNGVQGPTTIVDRTPGGAGQVRLLFVGRLSARKAPDLAVRALAQLRERGCDAVLEIVGSVFPGYEAFERDLHAAVRDRGLTDRVTFTGFLSEVWEAYARADIALVPSRVESLGNSAIETMLAGVPLVTTRVQGLVEVADGGRYARLVEPDDPTALADAVEAMLADWPATQLVAEAARRSALERFGPERYRAQVVEVAAGLVSR